LRREKYALTTITKSTPTIAHLHTTSQDTRRRARIFLFLGGGGGGVKGGRGEKCISNT